MPPYNNDLVAYIDNIDIDIILVTKIISNLNQ